MHAEIKTHAKKLWLIISQNTQALRHHVRNFFSIRPGEDKRARRKRVLIALLILGLMILTLKHCSKEKEPTYPAPEVMVQHPLKKMITDYVTQTGTLVAFNSVDLVARIEGFLDENNFVDGSFIEKNQLLFVIEPEPYLDKLKEAKATVAAKSASYDYSQIEYKRQQRMYQQNATSLNSVQEWETKVLEAKADLDKAKANEDNAAITYSYTHVRAPFKGRIGRHLVDVGNLVGNGAATKLATVEQIDPIYAYFNLNELDLIKLRASARKYGVNPDDLSDIPVYVSLQDKTDFSHEGRLNFANTGLNASTGTLEFRALLPNRDFELLPGLFVQVRVPLGQAKAQLTIPQSAVQYDQIGAYVMVVLENQLVAIKRVTVGAKDQNNIAITTGLTEADQVIVNGLQNATPGRPARIIEKGKSTP